MDDLYRAAKEGDLDKVHQLLDSGADVDQATWGATPLYIASEHGHKDVCALLLDRGADVNQTHTYGWTPLLGASLNGHEDICKLLLGRGAIVDQAEGTGATPLYIASAGGHRDVCALLLDKGADVGRADNDGWTPLFVASQRGHAEVCALLLDKGASVIDGALSIASEEGYIDVCKLLIEKGANVNAIGTDVDPESLEIEVKTPLWHASGQAHLEICRLLLDNDAKVDLGTWGETPLFIASQNDHADVCALLIRHGAQTRGALGGDLDDSITDALCQRPLVDLRDTFVHRRVENLEHMIKIMRHVEFIVLDEEKQCDLFNKLVEEKVALRKNSIDDIRAAWVLEETNISPQVQNRMKPLLYVKMATILNNVPNGGIEELRAMKINRSETFESYKHSIEIRFQMMLRLYRKRFQRDVERRARQKRRERRLVKSATRPPPTNTRQKRRRESATRPPDTKKQKTSLHEEINALRF